jgi:hypothetical protein
MSTQKPGTRRCDYCQEQAVYAEDQPAHDGQPQPRYLCGGHLHTAGTIEPLRPESGPSAQGEAGPAQPDGPGRAIQGPEVPWEWGQA